MIVGSLDAAADDDGLVAGRAVWAIAARTAKAAIAADKHSALIHRTRITLAFIVDPPKLPYLPRAEKATPGMLICKNSVKIVVKCLAFRITELLNYRLRPAILFLHSEYGGS